MGFVKGTERYGFYGVADSGSTVTYNRMKDFSELAKSANAKEYTRQYVDEEHERTDVLGYSESISFTFDYDKSNTMHADLAKMMDEEITGTSAVRSIIFVDLSAESQTPGSFIAVKRDYTVVMDAEGRDNFRTYSGTFKVAGEKVKGTATTTDGWETCTFTADED